MSLLGLDMLPWFDAPPSGGGDLIPPVFDEALEIGDVDAGFQGHREKRDGGDEG